MCPVRHGRQFARHSAEQAFQQPVLILGDKVEPAHVPVGNPIIPVVPAIHFLHHFLHFGKIRKGHEQLHDLPQLPALALQFQDIQPALNGRVHVIPVLRLRIDKGMRRGIQRKVTEKPGQEGKHFLAFASLCELHEKFLRALTMHDIRPAADPVPERKRVKAVINIWIRTHDGKMEDLPVNAACDLLIQVFQHPVRHGIVLYNIRQRAFPLQTMHDGKTPA